MTEQAQISYSEVRSACIDGDLTRLKKWHQHKLLPCLQQSADPNFREPHELAIVNGHLEVVQWLAVDSGQRIDFSARNNASARYAVVFDHLDILQWLLVDAHHATQASAAWANRTVPQINAVADDGILAQIAAQEGKLDILKWLLCGSGFPFATAPMLHRALLVAYSNAQSDVAHWIINESGFLPLMLRQPNTATTKLLSKLLNNDTVALQQISYHLLEAQLAVLQPLREQLNDQRRKAARLQDRLESEERRIRQEHAQATAGLLQSTTCIKAASAGLVTDVSELQEILERTHAVPIMTKKL